MLQQQEYQSSRPVYYVGAHFSESLSVLAYRSVVSATLSDSEIQELLSSAQSRNKSEGLTGVLLYDRGTFFQWLEGPTEAIARVWGSISRDPRHCRIKVLRDEPAAERVFGNWDLRIVLGSAGTVDAAVAALEASSAVLKRVIGRPKSLIDLSLEEVFSAIVIPRLTEVHGQDTAASVSRASTASIWHADIDCGVKLANVLLASRVDDSRRFVDSLLSQGANFSALYHEVFETRATSSRQAVG